MSATLNISSDRLAAALLAGRAPGFYGQVRLQLSLHPDALDCIAMDVSLISSLKPAAEPAFAPRPGMDATISQVAFRISRECRLVLPVRGVVAHYRDGQIMQYEIEQSP